MKHQPRRTTQRTATTPGNFMPHYFDIFKYVTPYSKSRVTWNSFIRFDYKPNLTKTSTFRDSYFNRIIPLWNSLPVNTKESTTLSSFKMKVRSH